MFDSKSRKFSDLSRLVFWSMNQVGGISCLHCFFLLYFLWLGFSASVPAKLWDIFVAPFVPCSLSAWSWVAIAASRTDAVYLNPFVSGQQGGECPKSVEGIHMSFCPHFPSPLVPDWTKGKVVWACLRLIARVQGSLLLNVFIFPTNRRGTVLNLVWILAWSACHFCLIK